MTATHDVEKILREPFPPEQIGKLPRSTCRQCANSPNKRCDRHGWVPYGQCDAGSCNGGHSTATIHLDYVGHAAATDRLLKADPGWTWEPLAVDQRGLPAFDDNGGLWIKMTVGGITRYGYGDSQGKRGPNAVKEAIGDAIRNAAMRFGVALDLWAKEDLGHAKADAQEGQNAQSTGQPANGQPRPNVQGRQNGNGHQREQGEANGHDPAKEAQALADAAKRLRSLNSLRGVHQQASERHLLRTTVAHPATGEQVALHDYIQERKTELQVAENAPQNDPAPAGAR